MKTFTALYSLLTERRAEVTAYCQGKLETSCSLPSDAQFKLGADSTYEAVSEAIRLKGIDTGGLTEVIHDDEAITALGVRQGQEFYRQKRSISALVQSFAAMGHGISEFAQAADCEWTAMEATSLDKTIDAMMQQAIREYEALQSANMTEGQFLRLDHLLHELRNYLSNAVMAHNILERSSFGKSDSTCSSILKYSHQQMTELLDRAQSLYRTSKEPNLEGAVHSVSEILKEIETAARPGASTRGVSIVVESDPNLWIKADRHLMLSAIANLVQNAIKYTNRQTEVKIRAFEESDQIVIEVEDRCGGLHEGEIERLFQPYVRGNSPEPGMGLGLWIARQAVEQNRGRIEARGLPNVGCVFGIRLPKLAATPNLAVIDDQAYKIGNSTA